MLIKVTMNDNDYTGIIENYFKRFIINYYYHLHKEYDNDAEKYVPLKINMEDILQKAMYKQKEMSENDYKIFETYIREGLVDFIYDSVRQPLAEEIIDAKLKIDFVDAIYDKDILSGNDEVVVYVLQTGKFINY